MPCTDGGVPYPPSQEERDDRMAPAIACALMTALEALGRLPNVVAKINWKEAGITRKQFEAWWERHKKRDAKRKAAEDARRAETEDANKALSKLSKRERELLGLPAAGKLDSRRYARDDNDDEDEDEE